MKTLQFEHVKGHEEHNSRLSIFVHTYGAYARMQAISITHRCLRKWEFLFPHAVFGIPALLN